MRDSLTICVCFGLSNLSSHKKMLRNFPWKAIFRCTTPLCPSYTLWLRTEQSAPTTATFGRKWFSCGSASRLWRFWTALPCDDECTHTQGPTLRWEITSGDTPPSQFWFQGLSARGASSNVGEDHKFRRTRVENIIWSDGSLAAIRVKSDFNAGAFFIGGRVVSIMIEIWSHK